MGADRCRAGVDPVTAARRWSRLVESGSAWVTAHPAVRRRGADRDRVRGRSGAADRGDPGAVAPRPHRRAHQRRPRPAPHGERRKPSGPVGPIAARNREAARNPFHPNAPRDPPVRDGWGLAAAGARLRPAGTPRRPRPTHDGHTASTGRRGPGAHRVPVPGRPGVAHRSGRGTRLQRQHRAPPGACPARAALAAAAVRRGTAAVGLAGVGVDVGARAGGRVRRRRATPDRTAGDPRVASS